jgi:hypothetical protein
MPNCSNCHIQVEQKIAFCQNCGAKLIAEAAVIQQPQNKIIQRTFLTNGIIIGAGIVLSIICVIAIVALNGTYANISSYLTYNGVSSSGSRYLLGDIVSLIAFSFVGLIFGLYFLMLGLLA